MTRSWEGNCRDRARKQSRGRGRVGKNVSVGVTGAVIVFVARGRRGKLRGPDSWSWYAFVGLWP